MGESASVPSLAEQIAWLHERAADAELLRRRFTGSGQVNISRAEQDAAMWRAILATLLVLAEVVESGEVL
jgi:hypothetical protein